MVILSLGDIPQSLPSVNESQRGLQFNIHVLMKSHVWVDRKLHEHLYKPGWTYVITFSNAKDHVASRTWLHAACCPG